MKVENNKESTDDDCSDKWTVPIVETRKKNKDPQISNCKTAD